MSDYTEHLISMAGGDGEPDLDAIQARADKATAGPWNADDGSYNVYDAEAYMVCADLADGDTSDFIAHSRTDVPALLALVRDQAAKLGRVAELASEWHKRYEQATVGDDEIEDALDDEAHKLEDIINGTNFAAITATEAGK